MKGELKEHIRQLAYRLYKERGCEGGHSVDDWFARRTRGHLTGCSSSMRDVLIWVAPLDWKPAENKFKCPCHGSGYDSEGINFEGPAPRPMDRARVNLGADGQIVVNVGRLYSWPKGQRDQFNDPRAYLSA